MHNKKVVAAIDNIIIEKDVTIPQARSLGHGYRFPFDTMEVGDSFVMPREMMKMLRGVATTANKRMKVQGKKFSVRAVVENSIDVVRCWRIS